MTTDLSVVGQLAIRPGAALFVRFTIHLENGKELGLFPVVCAGCLAECDGSVVALLFGENISSDSGFELQHAQFMESRYPTLCEPGVL